MNHVEPTPTNGVSADARTGVLDGFDRLKDTLSEATRAAVAARLRAGQSHDRIRSEVPAVATRQAVERFPEAFHWQESVFAHVQGQVEEALRQN